MNYKFYLIATIIIIIAPLVVTIIPKYIFYVNILAILFIVNGYLNFDKYIFLLILCVLLFRFIFMDKNKDKNKKGVVEYFDNDEEDGEDNEDNEDDERGEDDDNDNNTKKDFLLKQEDFKQDENMNETGIEEFLIKDKFSQLHDIIHEYQNALERNKGEMQKNSKNEL